MSNTNQLELVLESNQPMKLEEGVGSSFSSEYERRYNIKGR